VIRKAVSIVLIVTALVAAGCSAEGEVDDHKGGVNVEGNK
jgi:hypothetical protein